MIYFLNKDFPLLNFLNIVFIFASSADPDGIRHTATFHIIMTFEPVHEISNNVVYATCKASDQPAQTRSLIRAFACRLNIL